MTAEGINPKFDDAELSAVSELLHRIQEAMLLHARVSVI